MVFSFYNKHYHSKSKKEKWFKHAHEHELKMLEMTNKLDVHKLKLIEMEPETTRLKEQ